MKLNRLLTGYIIILYLISVCCNRAESRQLKSVHSEPAVNTDSVSWTIRHFYSNDTVLDRLVDSIYGILSDDERVAQMIMPAVSDQLGNKFPFSTIVRLYSGKKIGGVLYLKNRTRTVINEIKVLSAIRDSLRLLPIISSCDGEAALFHRKFTDADSLPPASSQRTINDVSRVTSILSRNISAMGLNMNFAPVADVSTNEVIIGKRSFGKDASDIFNKCSTFINISNKFNLAISVKHFPGHGAVTGDSHKGVVSVDGEMSELKIFQRLIAECRPVGVMVGHIAVKGMTMGKPSTISREIVTNLLKDSLKYSGIKITDAMNMGAVKNIPDADFLAVKAGIDMVVMPLNAEKLHNKLLSVMKSDLALKEQVTISIKKIIRLKICLGLIQSGPLPSAKLSHGDIGGGQKGSS
jgi:beta-N-acetylhexosaminidase